MTLAEVIRAIESKKRIETAQRKEKAVLDYTLAALIGRNVAAILNEQNTVPELKDAYSWIYTEDEKKELEEKKQEKLDKLSILRFKQFADSFNKRFKKEVANE